MNNEQLIRQDLAAAYRLLDYYRWQDLIFTHFSARVSHKPETFLVNEYGLLPSEISASNLLKVDVQGKLIDTNKELNPAAFTIHSALHLSRPDAMCVMHTHTPAGMAVAAMEEGLLPINQTNMEFYNRVSYYDYHGVPLDLEERDWIVAALGETNQCMILRNHGLLTIGNSVAEAFMNMYYLNKACEIQLAAMQANASLIIPKHELCEATAKQFANVKYRQQSIDLIWQSQLRLLDKIDSSYKV